MDDYLVKDLMVPLSEYATVDEEATLFEAVLALEKAQEAFDHTQYRHRAVLVLDRDQRVTGKVAQVDVLNALEPQAADLDEIKALSQFGFSDRFTQGAVPRHGQDSGQSDHAGARRGRDHRPERTHRERHFTTSPRGSHGPAGDG